MKLPPDRSHVATEQRHEESAALDELGTAELVTLLARDQRRGLLVALLGGDMRAIGRELHDAD
ncbi:MAG: hypothetical protein ACK5C3_01935, partial [bacterium]